MNLRKDHYQIHIASWRTPRGKTLHNLCTVYICERYTSTCSRPRPAMVALDASSEHPKAVADYGRACLNNLKHHSQHLINLSKPIVYTSFKASSVSVTDKVWCMFPCETSARNENTTFSNGCLGSHNDEERSEMRYVMRIAEFRESSNL